MPTAPPLARRLKWALGAVASLLVGAVCVFAFVVIDEAFRQPNGFGHAIPFTGIFVVVALVPLVFGGCLGMAVVPRGVAERGQDRDFAVAMGLSFFAGLMALPSPMVCFSWPLAAAGATGAVVLFLRTRARPTKELSREP